MKKKSLLVVPALGVLLLAAAGSVGGTVAWFSSVSSVKANAGTFASKATDGSLTLQMGAGHGTTAEEVDGVQSAKVASGDFMTHASYDHATQSLCTRSSETASGVRDVTDTNWIAKENFQGQNDIYWAVSWTMTFTYTFATESYVNLYFDPTSTLSDSSEGAGTKTAQGFRIAFVGEANGTGSTTTAKNTANTRIWAKNQTASAAKYVPSSSYATANAYQGAAYDPNTIIMDSAYCVEGNKIAEGTVVNNNSTQSTSWLGQFGKATADSTTSVLKFTCVAWFEGTDASVVTGSVMSSLSAAMNFYVRQSSVNAAA